MIGDTFKNLKNKYTEITVSNTDIDKKWEMLAGNLPEQDLPGQLHYKQQYAFAFAILILFIVTIVFAQAAKPGSLLYPVHTATEEITKGISNVFQSENHVTPPQVHISTPQILPTTKSQITQSPTSGKGKVKTFIDKAESNKNLLGSHAENNATYASKKANHKSVNNSDSRNSENKNHYQSSNSHNNSDNNKNNDH